MGAAAAVNRHGRAPGRKVGWLVGENWAVRVGHDGKVDGKQNEIQDGKMTNKMGNAKVKSKINK